MDPHDFGLEFTYESMTPQQYWDKRHEQYEKVTRSKKFYEGMNYAHREETVLLVKRALELAMETTDEWLDQAFEFDDVGNMIGVHIKLMVADVDAAVHDRERVTKTSIMEIMKEVVDDIKEIREDD